MAGARITFDATFDDNEAREQLQQLIARMDSKSGFLKNVGEHLLNSTRDRFAGQVAPDGAPWKPLRPSTIRERKRRGQTPIQILTRSIRSGLRASINLRVTDDAVTIGTPKVYAAIHQFGGTIERPAREQVVYRHVSWKPQKLTRGFASQKGSKGRPKANMAEKVQVPAHTITLPARPFLGLSKDDEQKIVRIADDWLRG